MKPELKPSDPRFRAATIECVRAEGDKPASVRMSVSSETPVLTTAYVNETWQRVWEVLDHGDGSIDMSRCADGLVVLDTHRGDQIGLIREVVVKGGKMGGVVEFCSSARAKEIAADAERGLRKNVSVGFAVDPSKYRIEGERDGVPVVRAMSWTPYEASFVPVPADVTVGVNRAVEGQEQQKPTERQHAARSIEMKKEDIVEIMRLMRTFDIPQKDVDDHIAAERSVAEFQALCLQRAEAKLKEKPAAPASAVIPPIGGGTREQEREILKPYSVLNVIRAMAGQKVDIGFEREVSDECAKMRGKPATGLIIPHEVLGRRDLTKLGTASASVATNLMAGEFIDLLRSNYVLGRLGVRFMTGLVGDISIPKMTAGATGYWVPEGGDITASTPTIGQVVGSPHTCGALVNISRRMLIQSTPSAEMMVREELVQRIMRTVQIAVFAGTGADGQPSAISSVSGINNPTVTTGTPTYEQILDFPGSIIADNAAADGQKFVMTAEVMSKLGATKVDAGSGRLVLDPFTKSCIGYDFEVTTDIPANSLWFGNWSTVVIGMWGNGIDVAMTDSALFSSGGVTLRALQDVDVMVRLGQALAYNAAVTS